MDKSQFFDRRFRDLAVMITAVAVLCIAATAGQAATVGAFDLTGTEPGSPHGDTGGNALFVDGWNGATEFGDFTIPADGFLTESTMRNDNDGDAETVGFLVWRPLSPFPWADPADFEVVHNVVVGPDDAAGADDPSMATSYPLESLPVQQGDVLGHYNDGGTGTAFPIPMSCCFVGPSDIQATAGNPGGPGTIFAFDPYPQAREYYFNVTLGEPPELLGDFNDDSVIDTVDAGILRDNLNEHLDRTVGYEEGDIDFNGKIDLRDFSQFKAIFQNQAGAAAATGVPEPSSVVLSLFALTGIAAIAQRRGHRAR